MKVEKITGEYLDANVFVLTKDDTCLIVDAGAGIEKIKECVGSKRVFGVLLTHGHYDHSLYALDYAKEFNCKVYISKEGIDILSDGQANYSEGNFIVTDFSNFVCLQDCQELQLGEFGIVAFETKGHSKDCVCFLIDNMLFAGDTLFSNGIGRLDLISSDKRDMMKSLKKLENVHFDVCYSGHGEQSTREKQLKNIAIYKRFLQR